MPLQPKVLFFYSQIFVYENGAKTISIVTLSVTAYRVLLKNLCHFVNQ
jgi:hypothetical protein